MTKIKRILVDVSEEELQKQQEEFKQTLNELKQEEMDLENNKMNSSNNGRKSSGKYLAVAVEENLIAREATPNQQGVRGHLKCDLCSIQFEDLVAFENHSNYIHKTKCPNCFRRYPSLRLLEMHVLEQHDIMFQVSSRNKNSVRKIFKSQFRFFFLMTCFLYVEFHNQ